VGARELKHVAEVLAAWREAERLLDAALPDDPHRELLVETATELRSSYLMLTDPDNPPSATTIAATDLVLDRALSLFVTVEERIGPASAAPEPA